MANGINSPPRLTTGGVSIILSVVVLIVQLLGRLNTGSAVLRSDITYLQIRVAAIEQIQTQELRRLQDQISQQALILAEMRAQDRSREGTRNR